MSSGVRTPDQTGRMTQPPKPLTVIGVVRSARTEADHTPVQAALNRSETASVQLHQVFVDGLEGLEGFDYAWLLTWLEQPGRPAAKEPPLRQVPFLLSGQQHEIGVFATRGPRRINPIGLSLVQLLAVDGAEIRFSGVDLIDGTPVIDIKPYVSAFDHPPTTPRCGWFDQADLPEGATPASLRAASPSQT
jgi:tRNA-Thr(GGU) m(6)t(6)A37 methyltransferase TsaA